MYSFSEEKEVQNGLFYHFIYKILVVNWSNMLHRQIAKNKTGPTSDQKMSVSLLYRTYKESTGRVLSILPAKMRHTPIASSGRVGSGRNPDKATGPATAAASQSAKRSAYRPHRDRDLRRTSARKPTDRPAPARAPRTDRRRVRRRTPHTS